MISGVVKRRKKAKSVVVPLWGIALLLLVFSGDLSADDHAGTAASDNETGAREKPLRIEYEAGEGIPRVFMTAGGHPLWSPDRQETSALFARIDNRVTRLSVDRPANIADADGVLETVWRNGRITASLRTEILDIENGISTVRLRLTLVNEGRNSRDVGVRYLFDTWLGEASDAHFLVQTDEDNKGFNRIEAERELTPNASVLESAGDEGTLRLLVHESTAPEQIVVANRERLSNAAWSYNPSRRRNFDLPPYSRNDSALHVTFAEQALGAGNERRVDMYFQVVSPEPEPTEVDESDSDREAQTPTTAPDEEASDETDLPQTREEATAELRRELKRLREISEGDRRPEEGELEEIRETIERLRRLRDGL